MKRRHHLPVGIALVLLLGPSGSHVDAAPPIASAKARTAVAEPVEPTVIVDGEEWQRDLTMWAVERFEAAGLALPPMQVRFHPTTDGCGGWNGLARTGGDVAKVDICRRSPRRVLLHELGHVWASSLDLTAKDAFAEFVGASSWGGSNEWHQRASEHAAEIIAWALSDGTIKPHTSAFDGFTGIDHAAAFEMLTGNAVPGGDGDTRTAEDRQVAGS